MLKVAVCDNERVAIEYLVPLLEELKDLEVVGAFTSQEELLKIVEAGLELDLVFMDIDWENGRNGILLSKMLFEMCSDTQIIYVTGYNDRFSQQIFLEDSNLCGYLVKPVQKELLAAMVNRAIERQKKKNDKFIINQKGVVQAIAYNEILYMESEGHHVIVHENDTEIQLYKKLDVCQGKLPRQFVPCHKSNLVNMDHIVYIDQTTVLLKNDKKIPISKSRYKEFRENYFKYMSSKM